MDIPETFSRPFDLLLGRKTYEIFAAHWPYEEGGPHDFIAKLFNKATKYVATTSSAPLKWTPSVAILEPATDVARLKRQDGPDLLIQGSSVLIQTLLDNDLIDQMNRASASSAMGQRPWRSASRARRPHLPAS